MALQITEPARQRDDAIIRRMAETMAAIAAERGWCLDIDLIDAGFDPEIIHDYAAQARDLAGHVGDDLAADTGHPIAVADRVANARALMLKDSPLSAAICARWAGVALRESGLPAELAVNPFDGEDEAALAHAFATGLAEGRRPPRTTNKPWTPIPGCTHAAHAAQD